MIQRAYGLFITLLFSCSLVLWISSCAFVEEALPRSGHLHGDKFNSFGSTGVAHRIAQVLVDGQPTYVVCAKPACPVATVKTLAMPVSTAAEVSEASKAPDTAETVLSPSLGSTNSRLVDAAVASSAPASGTSPTLTDTQGAHVPHADARSDTRAASASDARPNDLHRTVVTFALSSAELTQAAKRDLTQAMPWARRAKRIVISGRTDSLGPQQGNQRLALARALAVREYLRDRMLEVDNTIVIDARGSCCFVASNADSQGRQRNRRVEVAFRSEEGS